MTRFTEGYAASVAPLSRALRAFGEPDGGGEDRRWLWLACRLAQDLWDDELWHVLATRGVRLARDTGALNLLPNALNYLAALNVHSGAFATAAALIDEVDAITQATGIPPLKYSAYVLAAARDDQAALACSNGHQQRDRAGRGFGGRRGLLADRDGHNSHGRYDEALAAARHACEHEDVMTYGRVLVELVEAGVRAGRPDEAAAALDRLSERTQASGTEWALGIGRAAVRCWATTSRSTASRSSGSRAAARRSSSRAAGSCTGSGCGARTGAWTRASSCAPPTRASAGWARGVRRARAPRAVATGETARHSP